MSHDDTYADIMQKELREAHDRLPAFCRELAQLFDKHRLNMSGIVLYASSSGGHSGLEYVTYDGYLKKMIIHYDDGDRKEVVE